MAGTVLSGESHGWNSAAMTNPRSLIKILRRPARADRVNSGVSKPLS